MRSAVNMRGVTIIWFENCRDMDVEDIMLLRDISSIRTLVWEN